MHMGVGWRACVAQSVSRDGWTTAVRPIVVGLVLALLLARPALAQSVMLAWQWIEGEERRFIIESQLRQTIETEGEREPREIRVTHTFHVIERVAQTDEDGVTTITQTYQRVAVRGTDKGPEGETQVDWDSALRTTSTPPATPPTRRPGRVSLPPPTSPTPPRPTAEDDKDHPLVAPYAALAGKVITYRINRDWRVLSCEGADEAFEGAFDPMDGDGAMDAALALYRAAVTNQSLASQFEQGLRLIPGREVRRGETWDHGVSQTLPLVGELRTEMEVTLTRVRGRPGSQFATIDNKGGMSLRGGPAGVQSLGGLFQVNLGMSEMHGTTEFDAEAGQITSSTQHSVSEWEVYAPDFSDLENLGEPRKTTQRIEQDVSMRQER